MILVKQWKLMDYVSINIYVYFKSISNNRISVTGFDFVADFEKCKWISSPSLNFFFPTCVSGSASDVI